MEAEQLGYYDVAGNDHLSTQQYVRAAWPDPPDHLSSLLFVGNTVDEVVDQIRAFAHHVIPAFDGSR